MIPSIMDEMTIVTVVSALVVAIIGIVQFYVINDKSNKIEFMKQINDYENELINLGKEAPTGPNYYKQYRLIQFHKLYILNRIAYLKEQKLLDEKTVNFFQFRFEVGYRAYDWANEMEKQTSTSELESFLKFKTRFPNYEENTNPTPIQTYYLDKKKNDPKYNPHVDKTDPRN